MSSTTMHNLMRATQSLLVLDLCATVGALVGWPEGGTVVDGNAVRFDRETWERNLAEPNATGTIPVTGFDLSQRYPSQGVDGWTLSLNVSSDVPESESMNANSTSTRTFTGTSISLKAPGDVQSALANQTAVDETTWKICVGVLSNGLQQDSSAAENGTCSFLSSQCVTDLQQAYADKFSESQNCYGNPPPTPSSCGNSLDTRTFQFQQFPLTSANGTEVFVTASESHDVGDDAAWNNATRQVWPVLAVWGYNTRAQAPQGSTPQVQLSCIRANTVQQGSNPPSATEPRFRSSALSALVIAGVITWYTTL
ncbi:hypothetical protein GGR52DRAFT_176977 [Hypoxylon sp. FL1284]|nr:hypothetical protein GGR52DRAFT_176977 [Hypoxylon sp. FL1284]